MDEIIEVHMHGQVFMHSYGNRLHQLEVIQDDLVAHRIRDLVPSP